MLVRGSVVVVALGTVLAAGACASIAGIEDPLPRPPAHLGPDAGVLELVAGVTVSSSLVFAPLQCGTPREGVVTITNNSGSAVNFTGSLPDDTDPTNPTFTFSSTRGPTLDGTVQSGKDTKITIQARSSIPGPHTTSLDVRVGSASQKIPLSVVVNGAMLGADPRRLDFGELPVNQASGPRPIELRNDGNEPLSVGAVRDDETNFLFDPSSTIDIPAGGKATLDVSMTASSSVGPVSLDLKLEQTGGTKCVDEPVLTLEGTRVAPTN